MLRKFNTLIRLLIVGLLIYPMPIAMAIEQTVNEDFSDSTYQTGLTISGGDQASYIYSTEPSQYGTTGNSLAITQGTYTFEFTEDVYEVGFVVGAVNNAWSIKWYYADGTDETVNKNAQNSGNLATMYETIYKSYTDYNAVESNTDKFITKFDVIVSDISLLDTLYWQYDDGITAGIGDPSNLTTSTNLHTGAISIDWDAATGYQTNAERYAIAFSNDNFQSVNYAVATGNVGGPNALNTEYTFTKSYLEQVLNVTVGDTVYFKIRADNDTNSQYSNWTSIASYQIQDVASGVTNVAITNNEYQGLKLGWTQPNTGWSTVESYRIEYKLSSVETYTGIDIADATTVSYLIEDIEGGTYDFVVYSCTQSGSWCHGPQAGPNTNFEVLTTTAVTTTTTTTIYVAPEPDPEPYIPPPPPPEEIIVDISIEGVDKTYTQADVNDGTTTRDQERADNQDMFGCFMTNAQIERGDCEFEEEDDYADDGYLVDPNDETDDMPIYDETKVKEDSDIIESNDEDKNDTDDETDVEDELFEGDDTVFDTPSEEDIEELYEDIYEDLQDLTIFANDGWSTDETECFDEECEPLTQEQIEEQEEFFEEFFETYLEVDKFFEENKDVYIVVEEELFTEIAEDIIIIIEEEIIQEELPIEDEEVFEPIEEIIEEELPLPVEEDGVFGNLFKDEVEEVQLTEEELEIFVEETETAIAEVVEIPVEKIEIIEEEVLETLTEEEVEAYEEAIEEAVVAIVEELATEEQVEVIEAISKASVQDLAQADTTTKAVVQAVVTEVTKVETVSELSEEQKETVGAVLGFEAETAAEDVEIIAEQASKDENTAQAVEQFVERAIENKDVENFTLADVVTEVQVEAFLENPIGELTSVNIDLGEMDLKSIGSDMTSDQKEKAQEVVVPVIIVSQIVSQAGALMTRRF